MTSKKDNKAPIKRQYDIITMKELMKKGYCPFHPDIPTRKRIHEQLFKTTYEYEVCSVCAALDQYSEEKPPYESYPCEDLENYQSEKKSMNKKEHCLLHPSVKILVCNERYSMRKHYRPCEKCLKSNIINRRRVYTSSVRRSESESRLKLMIPKSSPIANNETEELEFDIERQIDGDTHIEVEEGELSMRRTEQTFFVTLDDNKASPSSLPHTAPHSVYSSPLTRPINSNTQDIQPNYRIFGKEIIQPASQHHMVDIIVMNGNKLFALLTTEELIIVLQKDELLQRYVEKLRGHGVTGYLLSEGLFGHVKECRKYFHMTQTHAVYFLSLIDRLQTIGVAPDQLASPQERLLFNGTEQLETKAAKESANKKKSSSTLHRFFFTKWQV